jgi:hypothetical protein
MSPVVPGGILEIFGFVSASLIESEVPLLDAGVGPIITKIYLFFVYCICLSV